MTRFAIEQGGMNETATYRASRILDTWVNHDWNDGLQLESVDDFTEIHVTGEWAFWTTRRMGAPRVLESTLVRPDLRAVSLIRLPEAPAS